MTDDTRCPECGEPVSATAAYCMHCYADLPSGGAGDDANVSGDRGWGDQENPDPTNENWEDPSEEAVGSGGGTIGGGRGGGTSRTGGGGSGEASTAGGGSSTPPSDRSHAGTAGDDQLLDPDGLVDNTLTIVVAIGGGIVVGFVGTIVLVLMTGSGWALPLGFLSWLVATAYLSRRRTVQGAIAHTCYAIAVVLLAIPLVAWSPVVEASSLSDRGVFFVVALVSVAIPAAIAGGIGFLAAQFVPDGSASEG